MALHTTVVEGVQVVNEAGLTVPMVKSLKGPSLFKSKNCMTMPPPPYPLSLDVARMSGLNLVQQYSLTRRNKCGGSLM